MAKKRAYKTYMCEVFNHSGFYPTWPPLAKIALGDVVRIESDGTFAHMTTLKELGIKFKQATTGTQAKYSYRSKGASAIATTVKAESKSAAAKGCTEIDISFADGGSIIFDLSNVRYTEIDGFRTIESSIIELSKSGKWQNDWLLVGSLVTAKNATILVANSKSSKVKYHVDGTLRDGIVSNLAVGDLNITSDQNMAFKLTASGPLTPMAKCFSLTKKLFASPRLGVMKQASNVPRKASTAPKVGKKTPTQTYRYKLRIQDNEFIDCVDKPANWD